MKKIQVLIAVAIAVMSLVSCQQEEIPQYQFKQYAYLWQDAYSTSVDGVSKSYPIIAYQFAILGDQPVDEIKINLTIVLKDGRSKVLTESDLTNFGQIGLYAPEYKYPKYWIGTCSDSKGIEPNFYDFTGEDVIRFIYEAKVRIGKNWFDLPKGANEVADPSDSIFI